MLYLRGIFGRVVLSFLFIRLAVAATTSDYFINPPDSTDTAPELTFTRGALVQLAWETNLERVALTLWHSSSGVFEYLGNDGVNVVTTNISNENSYPWLVDTKVDISENTFFFAIFDPGQGTAAFQSQNFSIIDAPSFTSTYATVLSTSAPTSTIIISASQTTTLITTSTYSLNQGPPTATVTNSGKSQGAKAEMGVGIGIGIGVPVFLAVGIYLGVVG